MPGSYRIDVENKLVYGRLWGVLTDREVFDLARALRADPRFDPLFALIVDSCDLADLRVTTAGVRNAAGHTPFTHTARRAIVVGSDESFGLTRMFGSLIEAKPEDFAIFRDLPAAFEWLGLPADSKWPEDVDATTPH
jgi:hypothetical protein